MTGLLGGGGCGLVAVRALTLGGEHMRMILPAFFEDAANPTPAHTILLVLKIDGQLR